MKNRAQSICTLNGQNVYGVGVQCDTRCVHFHSPRDVVAVRFFCCNAFYACRLCHDALADHPIALWPRQTASTEPVLLCGVCGTMMSLDEYLSAPSRCPICAAAFNPGCLGHLHLYFQL
ncbi:MAG: CHY zinc finger protein [Chthonomonadales bacterium]